jgi:hypothetical protein
MGVNRGARRGAPGKGLPAQTAVPKKKRAGTSRYQPLLTTWLPMAAGGLAGRHQQLLDGDDIFCLGAFLACSDIKLHALAFSQGFEAGA